MTPIEQALRDFIDLFDRLKIPYAVMGGLAVRAHGLPRATYDVDFTVLLSRNDLPAFYAMVIESGYDVPQEYETGWIDSVAGMPLVKASTFADGRALVIDLFLAETDFQRSLVARRVGERVNGFETWLVTPEDLILLKLLAARPRDIADVQDVLLMQLKLDEPYLRKWAEVLNVRERLEQALSGRSAED